MATVTSTGNTNIEVNKTIMVDGTQVKLFNAKFDTAAPDAPIAFSPYIMDAATYKENRAEIRAEEAKLEDEVYALQESMNSKPKGTK